MSYSCAELLETDGVVIEKYETKDVRWAPDGNGLVLMDKDTFCCAFEVEGNGSD